MMDIKDTIQGLASATLEVDNACNQLFILKPWTRSVRIRGYDVELTYQTAFSYSNRKKALDSKERFYTGRPCEYCQNQTRYAKTGNCVPCEHYGKFAAQRYNSGNEKKEQSVSKSKYELFNKLMGA